MYLFGLEFVFKTPISRVFTKITSFRQILELYLNITEPYLTEIKGLWCKLNIADPPLFEGVGLGISNYPDIRL